MKNCSKCKEVKPLSEFCKAGKKHRSNCKSCEKEYRQRPEVKARRKKTNDRFWAKNGEAQKEKQRKQYEQDPVFREAKKAASAKNIAKRLKEDNEFRVKHNLRSCISQAIKRGGYSKSSKTYKLIGLEYDSFRKYISNKFIEGMSWDNIGEWHIDHIIPISSAKGEYESNLLNHHLNLQPMWAKDNISKGDKYNELDKQVMLNKIKESVTI